ncbi:MAG TPA: DUF4282 domain-containing protein [Gammaproteobacteria bacterium]|nr:DUF4282 domain-containing protein [Gammaproteobacteria bacterium]
MEFRDLLYFDQMIVPRIITFLYWLLLVLVVLGGVGVMFTQSFFSGLIGILVGALLVRVWCELLIVMFKIHESLQVIKEK